MKFFDRLTGKIVEAWYERFGVKEDIRRELSLMNPGVPVNELAKTHLTNKVRLGLYALFFGLVLLILLIFFNSKGGEAQTNYVRASYGQEDQLLTLLATLQDGDDIISGEIELVIPAKELTMEEAASYLADAQETLYQAMTQLGTLDAIPALPSTVGGVDVAFYSLSPDILDDSFELVGDWPALETEVEVEAIFSIEGFTSRAVYKWTLCPAEELCLARKIELLVAKIQRGDYLDEEALNLPTEMVGDTQVSWTIPKSKINLGFLVLLVVIAPFLLWVYLDERIENKRKKYVEAVQREVPLFIHELILLLGAGMSVPNAWFHFGNSEKKGALQKEIALSRAGFDRGKSFSAVLEELEARIRLPELTQLCSLIIADIRLGDALLIQNLIEMNTNLWKDRKDLAKTKAAKADSKLLIPIVMMLVVILAVVMAPAVLNMKALGG